MADAPFTREFASYAWTGTELLIWGGATGQDCDDGCPRADGLASGEAGQPQANRHRTCRPGQAGNAA
jgi:hypothetical protein